MRSAAIGNSQNLAVRADGTLWGWVTGVQGDPSALFYRVGGDTRWTAVAGSPGLTLALNQDGSLWLSRGAGVLNPMNTDLDWAQVAAGNFYTLAIKKDGTLWGWGEDIYGQLGDGTTSLQITTWLKIGSDSNWATVVGSSTSSAGIRTDGSLWMWGANLYGQLGDGTTTMSTVPKQVGTDTDWVAVTIGIGHTVALKQDGTLWGWGRNSANQLGLPTPENRLVPTKLSSATDWVSVSVRSDHTLAINRTGELWSWGTGSATGPDGPPRLTSHKSDWVAIRASPAGELGVDREGRLWGWGFEDQFPRAIPTKLPWVPHGTLLTARGLISACTTPDGGLHGWGTYTLATLWEPTAMPSSAGWKAAAAGALKGVGVQADGSLWYWQPNTNKEPLITRIGDRTDWASVAAGSSHFLALRTDGSLWSWGANVAGQLGTGDNKPQTLPIAVAPGVSWRSVHAGANQSFAIRSDGTLWAWGQNDKGQLGIDSTQPASTPTQVGTATDWIACTGSGLHTLGLRGDHSLWAWGTNEEGELGQGTRLVNGALFARIPVRIGTDLDWQAVATGDQFCLALRQDGSIWAWGRNYNAQLGNGTRTDQLAPARIPGDSRWIAVAAAAVHCLAIRDDGQVFGWGSNSAGQLGFGGPITEFQPGSYWVP